MTFLQKNLARLGALIDGSAWLLILPAMLVLWFLDPAAAKTLLHWSVYFLVLAGMVVIISRIVFPDIKLGEWLAEARAENNVAAGLIVAAVILFVGLAMLAAVLWARPV